MTRLLLIEDDTETAEEVTGYFRGRGYEVDCAATGPDGLAQAGAGQADVLVVDRLLPGLDGLAVIEALRHAGVRLRIGAAEPGCVVEVVYPALFLSALSLSAGHMAGQAGWATPTASKVSSPPASTVQPGAPGQGHVPC